MASQWYCKILGREVGPVGFQDLAEMVRSGTLTEEDPVRRKGAREWMPAREVIGLFRAAERGPVEEAPPPKPGPEPAPSPSKLKRAIRRAWKLPRVGRRIVITASCTLILVVLAGMVVQAWVSGRHEPFPEPYRDRMESVEVDVAELSRPVPTGSSAPGLDARRPALIPGLEEIESAFSPYLTDDLCTIVFAAEGNPGTGFDLYVAKRESTGHAFEKPELIHRCASRQAERFPALSPDGLQLVFLRSETQPQLFHAKRETRLNQFGNPAPVPMPWVEVMNQKLEQAQFLGPSYLALSVLDTAARKRSFLFAVRPDEASPFGPGGNVPFRRRWRVSSQFFIAHSELRTYYAKREGIFVTARRSTVESFEEDALILEAEVTGPIKGSFWVAPQEDVVFYCSPGPADPRGSARRLWIIGF